MTEGEITAFSGYKNGFKVDIRFRIAALIIASCIIVKAVIFQHKFMVLGEIIDHSISCSTWIFYTRLGIYNNIVTDSGSVSGF